MKTFLAIAFLLACFGIVGRIDYECALISAATRADLHASTKTLPVSGWAR
jgi:hypothetical protein